MTQKDRERKPNIPPPATSFCSCSGKKKKKCTWAAVNYSRRKQNAFPGGFGEYDAVISAYLNSLTRAIKTQIQSATGCQSCL